MNKFVHCFCIIDVSDADNHLFKLLDVLFHRVSLPELHQGISGLPLFINNTVLPVNSVTELLKV